MLAFNVFGTKEIIVYVVVIVIVRLSRRRPAPELPAA